MSEIIKYGWLTDFGDKKFAPKSLFDYIYTSTTDGRNLTQWLSDFETALNNKDLQVNLASDDSVKFSSPGAIGVTGILDVNNGGLGISNPTQYGLLMGNGVSAVSTINSKAGFLISKTDGTQPLYSGIKALWESLQPDKQGPGFYIGFDNGDKRYYMGEVPLATSNQAGAVSTGTQTFEGAKTFNAATAFKSDVTMEGALSIKNNVTIQNGQLLFGNGSGVGQDHNDKIFITDKDDRAIFYVDATGIKSVEYHIKNGVYDTNLSTVIGRVGALEDRATDIETDLAQEVADRKDSVLYVALGTASKTTQLKNQAIGVDGVLAVTNGGTGHSSWTKNRIVYASATNALSQLEIGSSGQVLQSGGSSAAPSWITATSANTANTIVKRDSNGKFNTIYMESWAIELKPNSGVSHGGYIDFYYNGSTSDYTSRIIESSSGTISVEGNLTANAVYGAVWNDYAEYRTQTETVKPGYCVVSNNSGQVSKTTKRYQACDGIVSDTFGFAIGETDKCKTPLAVAGRVLAYCEGNRYNYQAGDTVCAGPDGKVCKMTREEIQMWPDRIVGIVSEIPEYETWGTGNVKVNGRIWIKIK